MKRADICQFRPRSPPPQKPTLHVLFLPLAAICETVIDSCAPHPSYVMCFRHVDRLAPIASIVHAVVIGKSLELATGYGLATVMHKMSRPINLSGNRRRTVN